jgi:hypothetical protein
MQGVEETTPRSRREDSGSDLVPRPDPTVLTTEQLRRELSNLREIIEAELRAVSARLDSMDKAADLLHANLTAIVHPNDLTKIRDVVVGRIEKSDLVGDEKFARIETQFTELDKRTGQLKTASDTAIAAAMAAAEKAVGENNRSFAAAVAKSEKNTEDSLKSLDNQFKTEIRSMTDKVNDIGSRQDKLDGSGAVLVGMGAAIVAVMSLLIAAYAAFHANVTPVAIPQPVIQYVPAPTAVPAPVTVPR